MSRSVAADLQAVFSTVFFASFKKQICQFILFPPLPLQVKQFHSLQTQRMEMQEEEDRERLANLRSVMEEQARRDKER